MCGNFWVGGCGILFTDKMYEMNGVTWSRQGIDWTGWDCGATLIMNRCCGCVTAVTAAVKGTDRVGGCSQFLFAFMHYHIPVIASTVEQARQSTDRDVWS